MIVFLTIIHVIVCLFLVVVVLLQSGKAADLAGAFGGMGSQTVFGPRGSATVLSRATTVAAALFMITSMSLSILSMRAGAGSTNPLLNKKAPVPVQTQPAQQPGQTVPITVTPSVGGEKGTPQNVQAPVVPNPAQKGTQPSQKKQ